MVIDPFIRESFEERKIRLAKEKADKNKKKAQVTFAKLRKNRKRKK